jgi:hypothetical protein
MRVPQVMNASMLDRWTRFAAGDGDTVKVDGRSYRLLGFDTPERSGAKARGGRRSPKLAPRPWSCEPQDGQAPQPASDQCAAGHLNKRAHPFNPKSIKSMLEGP